MWQRAAAAAVLLTVISGAGWAAASHYFDVSADTATPPLASIVTPPTAQFASAVRQASRRRRAPIWLRLRCVEPAPSALTTEPVAADDGAEPDTGSTDADAGRSVRVVERGGIGGSPGLRERRAPWHESGRTRPHSRQARISSSL